MSAAEVAIELTTALQVGQSMEPRTLQAHAGAIGVSDIGGCREKVRLTMLRATRTDTPDKWAAMLGSAVDEYMSSRMAQVHPDWTFQGELTITLAEGVTIVGHYDIFTGRSLIDIKTKDGLSVVRREVDAQHVWQVTLYLLGLIQAGAVAAEDAVAYLAYFDRSGRESEPFVHEVRFDQAVVEEALAWLNDVGYALRNDEQAAKDKPLEWCRTYCEFYTACRSGDEYVEEGLIEDPHVLAAVDTYLDGQVLENLGKEMKRDARDVLDGHAGVTSDRKRLRWVTVNAENPYRKIDVTDTTTRWRQRISDALTRTADDRTKMEETA